MLTRSRRRRASLLALASFGLAAAAHAQTVADQAEFNAAIAAATQPGRNDTIDVNAVSVSAGILMSLPGDASSLTINFNGVPGGPATTNPTFDVGFGTTGQLDMGAGTTLNLNTAFGIARMRVGYFDGVNGGNGTVNMTGGAIIGTQTSPSQYFVLDVGRGSLGSVGIFNQSGGLVDMDGGAFQVGVAQGTGVYTMTNDAVVNMGPGTVYIGDGAGANGTLYIHDSAQFLLNDPLAPSGQVFIGSEGGHGIVIQDGAGSRVVLNAQNGTRFGVGVGGGTGEYRISAGELVIGGIGSNAGITLGATIEGTGIFTQTGGLVTLDAGQIRFGPGSGTYTLDGGTLRIGVANPFALGAGSRTFNLGGGTIQALTDFSTALAFNLVGGASTIDTFDGTSGHTVTLSGLLQGGGALVKAGAGTLIFTGPNTYTGGTQIAGGTLQLGAGGSLSAIGALQVDAPSTFDLNGHTQTVGDLFGAGTVLLGTGVLTAGTANDTLFSGSIFGPGSFVKQGSGTLALTGDSTYAGPTTVNAGRLIVDGSLVSDVFVNSGSTLAGNGSMGAVDVATGATVAPGNLGTLTTTGITFAPGSIYQVEVNAAGQSDQIVASNAAFLNGGTVQVLPRSGVYSPTTVYTILTALGGVTGEFDGATSSFAFLTPSLAYDPTHVFLTLERNGATFPDVARTSNQRAVAAALEQLPVDNALSLAVLNQAEAGARQAFDALSGEVHASVSGILVDQSRFVREAIWGRLMQAHYADDPNRAVALGVGGPTAVAALDMRGRMALGAGSGGDAVPPYGQGLTFWSRGFGSWGAFDGNGNAAKVERNLGGFLSGMDADVGDGWRLGLATGYMQSAINVGARASSADVDSYTLASYGGGNLGPIALRSGAAWTWHSIDSSRSVIFPGFFENERASYNADTGQLFAEVSYPMVSDRNAIEPFARIAYVHVGTDRFTESGTIAALAGSSSDENVGYSTLGVRAATTLPVAGVMVTPRASVAWQHAVGDVTPDRTLAFASTGIAFGISGVPLARNSVLIETGLDFAIGPDAVLGLSYAGQLGAEQQDHGIQGHLTWRF